MATRSSIRFITQNGIFTAYSHYDGYPEGMADKLVQAINNSVDTSCTYDTRFVNLMNAFICGNPTTQLNDGEYYGNSGEEYLYEVDCTTNQIEMINVDNKYRITRMSIDVFINKYYTAQTEKEAKDVFVKEVNGKLVTRQLARKIKRAIRDKIKGYSENNPNLAINLENIKKYTF